jgi:hypothetical protein
MTVTLSGHPWRAHSPSFLEHATMPLWLAWDGYHWRVAVRGTWGKRSFSTRHEAAQLIADEFKEEQRI